jgi:ribonuclease HI
MSEVYALSTLATVFQSEIYAILVCSENCRNAQMRDKVICICSDSRASLLALSSYTIFSSLVSHSLQELSDCNRVKLFWVSGHCDINGNEKADELWRRRALSKSLPLSPSVVRQNTKEWALSAHFRYWT